MPNHPDPGRRDPLSIAPPPILSELAQQVNSSVLQVEPQRHRNQDRALIPYREALHVQETRARFWELLRDLVERRSGALSCRCRLS